MRKLIAAPVLAIALASALNAPAFAATPAKGKISATKTSLKWTGSATAPNPAVCPTPTDATCDHFLLTIDPIAGKNVKIVIDVPPSADFDVFVYGPDGKLVAEGGGGFIGEDETAVIKKPKKGTYEVDVQPYAATPGTTYKGSAGFVASK